MPVLLDLLFFTFFFILEDLGQGGYGSVHKAIDKVTNEFVAIKYVKRLSNV